MDAEETRVRKAPGQTRAEFRAQLRETKRQFDEANERIEKKAGRNLYQAIGIGLALGFAMLFSLIWVKELFMVVAGVIIVFAAFELASALRASGRRVPRIPTVLAGVAVVPAAFYLSDAGKWWVGLAGIALVVLWRTAEQAFPALRRQPERWGRDLAAGVWVQVYVVFLLSYALLLTAKPEGQWWALTAIILVIATDTGAYASGVFFGAHPMAPRISPKKTWEGFAGSVIAALIAGILLATLMLKQPWWLGVVFALAIVGSATVGDLIESLIKRDLGVKDMSGWLPGHGGFLDRVDSIIPSMPVAYVLFLLFA